MTTRRWARGIGLLVAAAAAAVVTVALQTGYRETEPPRDDVTSQDRADALLTEDEYPDGYELDRYEPGLSPTAPPDERRGFDPAACDALLEITRGSGRGPGKVGFRGSAPSLRSSRAGRLVLKGAFGASRHATGPDSIAVRTILEQGDGVVLHGAWAVERTAGQLIVLQAGTFGDFDEGQFIRLATAASRKVKDTLG